MAHQINEALYEWITQQALDGFEQGAGPLEIAEAVWGRADFPMHCPEHHYLTAACLLAAYRKLRGDDRQRLAADLAEAASRCRNVLGGFCGFYGACGAAVGCGVFLSVFTDATPITKGQSWGLVNGLTAAALTRIAELGGPRCCKRVCYTALLTAIDYMSAQFGLTLPTPARPCCTRHQANEECIAHDCPYYQQ